MPCMGPDLNWYRDKSKEAHAEIVALLDKKYNVCGSALFAGDQRRYEEDKDKLAKVLEEMFVHQGCADF